jgi:hypothetical protein
LRFAVSTVAGVSGLILLGLAFYGQPAVYLRKVQDEWDAFMDHPVADLPADQATDEADRVARLQLEVARLESELAAQQGPVPQPDVLNAQPQAPDRQAPDRQAEARPATPPIADGELPIAPGPPLAASSQPATKPLPFSAASTPDLPSMASAPAPEAPPAASVPSPPAAAMPPPAAASPAAAIPSAIAPGPSAMATGRPSLPMSATEAVPAPPAPASLSPPSQVMPPPPVQAMPSPPIAAVPSPPIPAPPILAPPAPATLALPSERPASTPDEAPPAPAAMPASPAVLPTRHVPDRREVAGEPGPSKTEPLKTEPPQAEPVRPPPQRQASPKPGPAVVSQPSPPRPDGEDAQSVLARLRQSGPASAPPQPADPLPAPEPRFRPQPSPALPKLGAARAALASGRIEDARRLLQEAQLQLVFRPLDAAGEDQPSAGKRAADVAHALEAMGANDLALSRRYIDAALGNSPITAVGPPTQQSERRVSGYAPAYPGR